jgi:hypothetical protein
VAFPVSNRTVTTIISFQARFKAQTPRLTAIFSTENNASAGVVVGEESAEAEKPTGRFSDGSDFIFGRSEERRLSTCSQVESMFGQPREKFHDD